MECTEDKQKKIKAEFRKLKKIFSEISDDKKKVAHNLMERVAFMTITLKVLEDDINEKGPVVLMINGKQQMNIENPAQKSYNTMINRYTATYSKLIELLPKDELVIIEKDDGFMEFVGKRG